MRKRVHVGQVTLNFSQWPQKTQGQICWIIGQQTIAERNVECIFYCWTAGSCLEWNKLMMYVCTLEEYLF